MSDKSLCISGDRVTAAKVSVFAERQGGIHTGYISQAFFKHSVTFWQCQHA